MLPFNFAIVIEAEQKTTENMEKNIYLECEQHQSSQSLRQFIVRLKDIVSRPVRWFSAYYSAVLGREISMRQTLHLLNAQLAFVFVVLPADISFVARAVCCGWLLKAVMACRKSL